MEKVDLVTKAGWWCRGLMMVFFTLPFFIVDDNQTRLGILNVLYIVAFALFVLALAQAPVSGKVLKTNGVYKYTRHPFYWALLLINLATWLQVETWTSPLFLLVEVLFLVSLAAAIHCQERETCERFGEEGVAYHKRTPRFFSYIMLRRLARKHTRHVKSQARSTLQDRKPNIPEYTDVKVGVKESLKGRYDRFVAQAKATLAALKK